jgi:hypothetical protein
LGGRVVRFFNWVGGAGVNWLGGSSIGWAVPASVLFQDSILLFLGCWQKGANEIGNRSQITKKAKANSGAL